MIASPGRAERRATRPPGPPRIVCLSTRLLTDRMILYGDFLPAMRDASRLEVWSASHGNPLFREETRGAPARFEPFPAVREMRARLSALRRVAEYAWDRALGGRSRESFWRLRKRGESPLSQRALKAIGSVAGACGLAAPLERWMEPLLLSDARSAEARARLLEPPASLLLATSPFRRDEPGVVAEAKKLGIRVAALVTSWDNLSTKSRMMFRYDGYLVWSEWMREELERFYPQARSVPVRVVGAPQFDVFFRPEFRIPREEFCRAQGLRPDRPILLYGLGSPQLLREHHGAIALAERIARGDLGEVQLLVRPHPVFETAPELRRIAEILPSARIQWPQRGGEDLASRFQDRAQIVEWVNTLRHADAVVNLSSTLTIDAAICDRPVVNLDYDPEPGAPNGRLVREINHAWEHFRPIAESGGVTLVPDLDATVAAIRGALADPGRDRAARRRIAERVAGPLDGRAGRRLAEALLELAAAPRAAAEAAPR